MGGGQRVILWVSFFLLPYGAQRLSSDSKFPYLLRHLAHPISTSPALFLLLCILIFESEVYCYLSLLEGPDVSTEHLSVPTYLMDRTAPLLETSLSQRLIAGVRRSAGGSVPVREGSYLPTHLGQHCCGSITGCEQ